VAETKLAGEVIELKARTVRPIRDRQDAGRGVERLREAGRIVVDIFEIYRV
jgi:hypothetical protein